mmetsp:Transcript_82089/g.227641  ORF Transcript_82089/g.227641 Transcript_82089/m.227641 type:complete len:246 (-) Transcript_82089:135-872(-)
MGSTSASQPLKLGEGAFSSEAPAGARKSTSRNASTSGWRSLIRVWISEVTLRTSAGQERSPSSPKRSAKPSISSCSSRLLRPSVALTAISSVSSVRPKRAERDLTLRSNHRSYKATRSRKARNSLEPGTGSSGSKVKRTWVIMTKSLACGLVPWPLPPLPGSGPPVARAARRGAPGWKRRTWKHGQHTRPSVFSCKSPAGSLNGRASASHASAKPIKRSCRCRRRPSLHDEVPVASTSRITMPSL